MKRLKTLGPVALAIAALTAFVCVSSAPAAQFKSSSSPVMLFGQDSGNHRFSIDGQNVTCTNAVFEKASLATPANTVPGVTAAYNGCTAFGFAGASVNMGSCTYELLTPTASLIGNMAIRCGMTPITINVAVFGSECSVSIGEATNTNLGFLKYQNNNPAAGKFLVTFSVTAILATKNKDNGLCPLSGLGNTITGHYNGPLPVEGTSGITISVA